MNNFSELTYEFTVLKELIAFFFFHADSMNI